MECRGHSIPSPFRAARWRNPQNTASFCQLYHTFLEGRSFLEALDFGTYRSCLRLGFGICITMFLALPERSIHEKKSCCTKSGNPQASWEGEASFLWMVCDIGRYICCKN